MQELLYPNVCSTQVPPAPVAKPVMHCSTHPYTTLPLHYTVQFTVNSVQCTVYRKQCTVYSVQYTVYSIQYT